MFWKCLELLYLEIEWTSSFKVTLIFIHIYLVYKLNDTESFLKHNKNE